MNIMFGPTRSISTDASQYPTVSSILGSSNLKAVLGFPESVSALVNGVEADAGQVLVDDDNVEIRTIANTKGN
jgi:hypothetical protein